MREPGEVTTLTLALSRQRERGYRHYVGGALLGLCLSLAACSQAAPPATSTATDTSALPSQPDSPPLSPEASRPEPAASSRAPQATLAPTIAPALTATPEAKLPLAKRIGPLTFISQTLNNCGPASVAEVLGYWGVQRTQAQVAAVLRPDLPDYGMSLYGVPFYAESVGLKGTGGINGSAELIKAFIAGGFPVIVADLVSPTDHTRHFRPIDGYDDTAGFFIGSDPYLGPNHKISYPDFDEIWKISTQRWVVMYPPDKQPAVDAVLARYWNKTEAAQLGLQKAQQRMGQQPKLPWTWLEMADVQIDSGDLKDASANIQKGSQLGLPYEAHWLQLKLQRAAGNAA